MAKTITVDLELKYKEAVKNLDEFQKEYTKLEKSQEDTVFEIEAKVFSFDSKNSRNQVIKGTIVYFERV